MTWNITFKLSLVVVLVGALASSASPQPILTPAGSSHTGFCIGTGFNTWVQPIALASDGSGDLYLGGGFTSYNGTASNRIIRLNSNGTVDAGFNVGTGFNDQVTTLAIAPDSSGDLYVGGLFTSYNGNGCNYIVRLNSNGTIDTTFSVGTGFNSGALRLVSASDGSGDLYVGGYFTSYNGTTSDHLVRLNSNGTIDAAFNVGTGFNNHVYALGVALEGSGDLYVGGVFTGYNGTASNNIVRLNSNGTIDTAFNVGTGFNQQVSVLALAPDGSGDLYLSGHFTSYNGTGCNYIVRLNSNGTIDSGFNIGTGLNAGAGDATLLLDESGDLYVGGAFTGYNGTTSNYIVRLNPSGTIDADFNVGTGFNSHVYGLAEVSGESGELYVGGLFTSYNGIATNRIIRLNSDGTVDPCSWEIGDVFVAVSSAQYKVYDNDGNFKETITQTGQTGAGTAGARFNQDRSKLYTTNFSATKVVVFDGEAPHSVVQTVDTNAQSAAGVSLSIVFAGSGDFYVGHAQNDRDILRYNAAGDFQQRYNVAEEGVGSSAIELAADQRTMYYTSQGRTIFRYDVSGAGTQLSNFVTLPGSGRAFVLRLLPPGDVSGGLIVADEFNIKRLDSSGTVTQTYDVAGEDTWYAMSLDPNGTSLWAGNFATSNFYRINIATGAVEVGPINTGTVSGTLFGICVKDEYAAAENRTPAADAGLDQIVEASGAGTTVTLNGSASSDPEGTTLTFEWKNAANQVVGTTASPTVNLALGIHTFTLKVSDGQQDATDSVQITVQDTTAPAITQPDDIQVGSGGSTLVVVTFSITVADAVDPSPTVAATPPSGSGFPVGTTSVNVTATDASGNSSTRSFKVIRTAILFTGFLSPLGGADATGGSFASPLRAFKLNSTIPIKFTASSNGQAVTTGVHTLALTKYSGETTSDSPIDATPQGQATSGNQFQLSNDTWHFNLDTEGTGMTTGIWLLTATLSDGSKHTAWIQIK